jgi:hypothetical protein
MLPSQEVLVLLAMVHMRPHKRMATIAALSLLLQ